MFKDDDDKDEGSAFGITRYPCMPSLVALQQMRNRLHLAFLGKKLMKWTALATGREMRRLAQELYDVYAGFGEDLRNAFILLARCRYFYPPLNGIVLEDIGLKAGVIVQQCSKTISGVKIVQFDIYETEHPPYPHLGLEKGGQTIMETKKAWLELLKRLIMMMQLRASFLMVELAHKNANKKMNVLGKVVIPRTNVTMEYINNELEEYAREEFFRLKKVLEIKRKMYGDKDGKKKKKKKEDDDITCPACIMEAEAIKKEKLKEPDIEISIEEIPQIGDLLQDNHVAELVKQINEIVDVTKDMDKKGLVTASVGDFIKTAEELRAKLTRKPEPETKKELKNVDEEFEKVEEELRHLDETPCIHPLLEDAVDFDKLCDTCREKYKMKDKSVQVVIFEDIESEALEEPEVPEVSETPEAPTPKESKVTIKSKLSSTEEPLTDADDDSDTELGTFETEVKEITKIIRTRNEDGSISIQKKVIKIEKHVRPVRKMGSQGPSRNDSASPSENLSYQTSTTSSRKSNPYSDSRTVGAVTVPVSDIKSSIYLPYKIIRKAKSEMLTPFSPMSDPMERSCVSSVTLLSTDLDCDDFYVGSIGSNNSVTDDVMFNNKPRFCYQFQPTSTHTFLHKNDIIDKTLNETQISLLPVERMLKDIGNNYSLSNALNTKKSNKKLSLSVSLDITSSFSSSISSSLVIFHETDKNKKKEQ